MDRKVIESSMLRSIGYDPENAILEIEFNSGDVWQYFDFPEAMWYEFEGTDSHGKFFHREIKNQYSESRV
ncbi:MAG: KTSC domain-containing protein [gamma proteobacterium symbiont of Taylorina sp.]|nr:KTSC domain-containing protein [gamma proteobacterium symbiont of Taylorina sp.]